MARGWETGGGGSLLLLFSLLLFGRREEKRQQRGEERWRKESLGTGRRRRGKRWKEDWIGLRRLILMPHDSAKAIFLPPCQSLLSIPPTALLLLFWLIPLSHVSGTQPALFGGRHTRIQHTDDEKSVEAGGRKGGFFSVVARRMLCIIYQARPTAAEAQDRGKKGKAIGRGMKENLAPKSSGRSLSSVRGQLTRPPTYLPIVYKGYNSPSIFGKVRLTFDV